MILAASILILSMSQPPSPFPAHHAQKAGDQLLDNIELSDGARGWILKGAKVLESSGPTGGTAVVLSATEGAQKWSNLGVRLSQLPTEHELNFSVFVQGIPGAKVTINSFAYGEADEHLESWHASFPVASRDWTALEQTYVLPGDTEMLAIWVISSNTTEVLVARPSLTLGKPERSRNLTGPGVLRASASTAVRATEAGTIGHVLFPVPLRTEHQVPLTFTVTTEPPSALCGFRWIAREDGTNWLCEVDVEPEGDGTLVSWESLVLVRGRDDQPLPSASEPEVPEEAAPWLRSTACIQSDDEAIRAKARELGSEDIAGYVGNVLQFTSQNQGVGEPFVSLDAKNALGCGGSCTSRANLAAALLRAGGIPARTAAHLPTWSGPLYEHWHVEYWHPGAGWTWIEPTLGKLRPKPWSLVVLNVANPDDEDAGFDPVLTHSGVMLGVPRFAVHEHSEELQIAAPAWRSDNGRLNQARAAVSLEAANIDKLFSRANRAWEKLAADCQAGKDDEKRTRRIEAALSKRAVAAALARAL